MPEQTNLLGEVVRDKFEPHLKGDYKWDEVTSSLQKSIRRGKEFDACFWAAILYKSGFSGYLGRRLRVIAHEDVGVANPQALILANQLWLENTYKARDKKYESQQFSGDGLLPYFNLIVILCRGEKTRMGDELINLIQDGIEKWDLHLEIPEYAIDPHTERGRAKYGYWESGTKEESHNRIKLWFDKFAMLINEWRGYNPYKEELKEKWGYYDSEKAPVKEDRK
jgi:replication-associated recombination protein RarA